jgi:hypothetical protein
MIHNQAPISSFSFPEQVPVIPYEERTPFFYMRIQNIVSDSIHELPPVPDPYFSQPIFTTRHPSTQESIPLIPSVILSLIQNYRKFERHGRSAQTPTHPPAPIRLTEEESVTETLLGMNTGLEITEVMKRGDDLSCGIWHPQEIQDSLARKDQQMAPEFFTGDLDVEFFEKKITPTGTLFFLRHGKSPTAGLMNFLRGTSIATCGMTVQACGYKALLNYYGPGEFDRMFSSENPLSISEFLSPVFFEKTEANLQGLEGSFGNRPVQLGDFCWFENVRWYWCKHPAGGRKGLNCICLGNNEQGEQVFGGLGLTKPSTEGEIYQWLIDTYNQPRNGTDWAIIHKAIKDDTPSSQFDPAHNLLLKFCDRIDRANPRFLEQSGLVCFRPEGCFRLKRLRK